MTDESKRCTARNRQGGPCGRSPMLGQRVCASHGGKSPSALAAAQRRLEAQKVEEDAVRAVQALSAARGPMTISEVYRELLSLSGLVVAWKDVLRDRVEELTAYTSTTAMGAEQVRADVILFERAIDRAAKVLETVARLDLDARIASVTQRDGELLAGVAQSAMVAAGLSAEQEARFNAAMADGLRSLAMDRGGR